MIENRKFRKITQAIVFAGLLISTPLSAMAFVDYSQIPATEHPLKSFVDGLTEGYQQAQTIRNNEAAIRIQELEQERLEAEIELLRQLNRRK